MQLVSTRPLLAIGERLKRTAGQMVEVSQYPGDTVETVETVELRKKFFERYTDRDECQAALHERRM